MSNQNSVFLPSSNGAKFQDLFSETSQVPEFVKGNHSEKLSDKNKIIADIKRLVNESKQTGGNKKTKDTSDMSPISPVQGGGKKKRRSSGIFI